MDHNILEKASNDSAKNGDSDIPHHHLPTVKRIHRTTDQIFLIFFNTFSSTITHVDILYFFRQEVATIARKFYEGYNIPMTIGCVDGTHIRIKAPTENEPIYVNHKGYQMAKTSDQKVDQNQAECQHSTSFFSSSSFFLLFFYLT